MTERDRIEQAAAHWVMRRSEPDWSASDDEALAAWLEESVAARAAFWRLSHGYSLIDRLSAVPGRPAAPSPRHRLRVLAGIVATACALAACAVLLLPLPQQPVATHYRTAIGKIDHVVLADGTVLDLDSDTRIRVLQDDSTRHLWLDRGRIFVAVAKDRARPFITHSGGADIVDIGTEFAVAREQAHVSVSVVEGKVRLSSALYAKSGSTIVAAGEVARTDGRTTTVEMGESKGIDDELAWRRGAVIFRDTRLIDAAAYLNRYNRDKLEIAGDIADLRIGGSFRLDNVAGFSRLLAKAYALEVRQGAGTIKISRQ